MRGWRSWNGAEARRLVEAGHDWRSWVVGAREVGEASLEAERGQEGGRVAISSEVLVHCASILHTFFSTLFRFEYCCSSYPCFCKKENHKTYIVSRLMALVRRCRRTLLRFRLFFIYFLCERAVGDRRWAQKLRVSLAIAGASEWFVDQ
ncbi:unnamed protein product [Vicia faba]|uniref:Uncharacterized protein n=1 Tax=Vicia faba TaxID=3906 RepID=A0AAV1AS10_VICFA|nr:unnamed protein product [Vicia faba]